LDNTITVVVLLRCYSKETLQRNRQTLVTGFLQVWVRIKRVAVVQRFEIMREPDTFSARVYEFNGCVLKNYIAKKI